MNDSPPNPIDWRRRALRWCVTLLVVGLVAWFAGGTLRRGWQQLATTDLSISLGWTLLAGVIYVLALTPMAGYWWLVLRGLHQRPAFGDVLQAYYLGHLGKYVPGKAMVIVLRTQALRRSGCGGRATAVSVLLETLTFMATGAALAAGLLAVTGGGTRAHALLAAGLAVVAGLPVLPPVARWAARRVIRRGATTDDANEQPTRDVVEGIGWGQSARGVLCATLAWTLLAVALWATARAVGVDSPSPLARLPLWIECATLPTVAGFVSLIPGGLFVRDALVAELLAPDVPAATALVVAALWRVVTIVSEVVVCGMLVVPRLYRTSLPPDDTP